VSGGQKAVGSERPSGGLPPTAHRPPPTVVINMSTSRVIEDIAARHGARCERVAVGEVNVASRMRSIGAVIGGEGNGGVIDPRVHYGRDSLVGMALLLECMAKRGRKLSELAGALPRYHMRKTKADCSRRGLAAVLSAMRSEGQASGAKIDELDGLRLDWPDAWVHVRPSNTEPIVRVIGEAADERRVEALVASHVERVRELGAEGAA